MLGLDLSNYTTNVRLPGAYLSLPEAQRPGGVITPDHVKCWMDAGYTHAIIGTQWPLIFQHQAEICLQGGMTIDAYSWLDWAKSDGSLSGYIRERNDLIRDLPVITHWLDCEQARGPYTYAEIVDKIDFACEVADEEREAGIYTAAWWWPANTGDSKKFADRKLWHAGYPYREGVRPTDEQIAALSISKPHPYLYGGWDHATIWQFAGSVQLCATNQDLNLIDDSYLEEVMQTPEFIRYNPTPGAEIGGVPFANPAYWAAFSLAPGEAGGFGARADFNLPAAAKAIQLQVEVAQGSFEAMDGATADGFAGECFPGPTILPRVTLDDAGNCWWRGGPAGGAGIKIRCLGWYE